MRVLGGVFRACFHRVHSVQVVGASEAQDLPDTGVGPLVVCSVLFVRFVALPLLGWLEICLYSHFKGVYLGL